MCVAVSFLQLRALQLTEKALIDAHIEKMMKQLPPGMRTTAMGDYMPPSLQREAEEAVKEAAAAALEAARGDGKAELRSKLGSQKYFVGLGTGPHIPKFLRFNGKVRYREIRKGDLEALIKRVWADKAVFEAKQVCFAVVGCGCYEACGRLSHPSVLGAVGVRVGQGQH